MSCGRLPAELFEGKAAALRPPPSGLEFDLVKTRRLNLPPGRVPSTNRARAGQETGELCTVDFAADLLKVHPRTIHRFIHEGRLPAKRIGKAYRIRRADLAELAGLPEAPRPSPATLTAFLDVADVTPEAARLWKRTASTATASRGPTAPTVEVIYDAETRRLKLIVVGLPAAALAFLAQAEIWLQNIR